MVQPLVSMRASVCLHRARCAVVALFALVATARCDCGGPPPNAERADLIERIALPGEALRGLSGLTRIPGGDGTGPSFLAVSERTHHLIPIAVTADGPRAHDPLPILDVDPDLDLEGLAFSDAETLVFATEADYERNAEKVLFARWEGDRAEVFRVIEFDYDPWGLVPTRNRGLEGICVTGRAIVAASEMVDATEGRRWSPVAVFDLEEEAWTPYRVFLTSETGKLSGLACLERDGGIEVTAIERHFDLLHVVRFDLRGAGGDVQASVQADLRPGFDETPPNFEGLERQAPGVYFLITDNDWRGVRGPTEMIRWEEPAEAPHPGPDAPSEAGTTPARVQP